MSHSRMSETNLKHVHNMF